jgi:hypothetical protein
MNIDAKQIAGLVEKAAKNVAGRANPTPAMESLAAAPTTPTKGALKSIASGALDVLKAVGPDLVGLIPGVGPFAKIALSTLNDDEWFSEFAGAGVTANEFLSMGEYRSGVLSATGAITVITCAPNVSEDFKANFMPAVLAYVRNHTNNVLVDNTSLYSVAFDSASALYAIYYQGQKYIKLSEHQPLNIPILSEALPAIEPRTYSQFKGMVEALGDFLKTSVRLPYAWVEYLRWRFGTTFYSENTGKPGLILYDFVTGVKKGTETAEDFLTRFQYAINASRNNYVSAGRAGADLKLAYENHQIRYDVENAHHDAKEFNLRTNLSFGTTGESSKAPAADDNAFVFIDSRLDQSAALQAVTISTATGIHPIVCTDMHHCVFVKDPFKIKYTITHNAAVRPDYYKEGVFEAEITTGWHTFRSLAATQQALKKPWGSRVPNFFLRNASPVNGVDRFNYGLGEAVMIGYPYLIAEPPIEDDYAYLPLFPDLGDGWFTDVTLDREVEDSDAVSVFLTYELSYFMLTSLQFHNTGLMMTAGGQVLAATPLAYDVAYVSKDTLRNIQRTAMRNLTRGDYRAKTQTTSKVEVREAISEVETAALSDIKDHATK